MRALGSAAGAARFVESVRWATALTIATCGAGTFLVSRAVAKSYPLADWIVWSYVELWVWLAFFSVSCTSFGCFALRRWVRLPEGPALETAVLGMALGCVLFVVAMFVGGALGAFHSWFALALPAAFLTLGAPDGVALGRQLVADRNVTSFRSSGASTVAFCFGLLALALTYFTILSPDALGYDATWFHVKIAQDYARWRRIGPFPGDYSHALPHLASILYTWGYLLPGLEDAQRWLFALHMEFCLLLWTLAAVHAAVARQLRGPAPRGSWAAFFLFPSFFYYGLWGTADHILAFFAVPIGLATLRVWYHPGWPSFALLGAMLAGAVLTKYQAAYLAVPVAALVVLRCIKALRDGGRHGNAAAARRQVFWGVVALAGVGALLASPHFIKNLVYYGNPLYPFAQDTFTSSRPTMPEAALLFKHGMQPSAFVPKGDLLERLRHSLDLLVTVPELPRSQAVEASGSLFVVLLPVLLWLRQRFAIGLFAALGLGALLVWGMLLAHTRYLEGLTPLLAAVLAALVIRVWRLGPIAQLGLVPMLGLQALWVLDGPLHSPSGGFEASLRVLRAAASGKAAGLFSGYRSNYVAVGKRLPADAKIVMHTFSVSLGIDRDVLMDSPGFQGLIDYRPLCTPRELFDRFRTLGVTHTLHEPSGYPSPTVQEDILFHALVIRHSTDRLNVGGLFVAALPEQPPPVERPYRVLTVGLPVYEDGVYPIERLSVWTALPRKHWRVPSPEVTNADPRQLLGNVDAVACAKPCSLQTAAEHAGFRPVRDRAGDSELYLRQ